MTRKRSLCRPTYTDNTEASLSKHNITEQKLMRKQMLTMIKFEIIQQKPCY